MLKGIGLILTVIALTLIGIARNGFNMPLEVAIIFSLVVAIGLFLAFEQ